MSESPLIQSNPEIHTSRNYRADIDGLRAVAVVPVVLFHAQFSQFSGGFVGVDIFFVISGYLITSLILPEVRAGTFSLIRFYERRVRRLFPALFSVLIVSCIAAGIILMPVDLEDFGESVATTAIFASNFMFYSEDGYFDGPAEFMPLLHTWSLAIEEQYYLLFPLFLVIVTRYASRVRFDPALAATVCLLIASFAWSCVQIESNPRAAFFLLPSRMWELLLGAILAMGLLPRITSRERNEIMSFIGLSLIGWAIFTFNEATPFPGPAALAPCVGAFLLIYSGSERTTLIARLLACRPLVFIGLISYSLYLWHWPVFVFAKHYLLRDLSTVDVVILMAASVLLAFLSWRYVELPFRGTKGLFNPSSLFRLAAASMLVIFCAGTLLDVTKGLPSRLSEHVRQISTPVRPDYERDCIGINPDIVSFASLCRINPGSEPASFILWGDSHAASLLPEIERLAQRSGLTGINATAFGCPPLADTGRVKPDPKRPCKEFNSAILDLIESHPSLTTIILSARWAQHAEATPYKHESGSTVFLSNHATSATSVADNREVFGEGLKKLLMKLDQPGRTIRIIDSIPEVGWNVPVVMGQKIRFDRPIRIGPTVAEFQERQAFVATLFRSLRAEFSFRLIPLAPALCDDSDCRVIHEGLALYTDGDHLSRAGAALVRPALAELFNQAPSAE